MRNTKQLEEGWGVFGGFQNFIVRRTESPSVGLVGKEAGKMVHNSCIWMIIMSREEIHAIPPKYMPIYILNVSQLLSDYCVGMVFLFVFCHLRLHF